MMMANRAIRLLTSHHLPAIHPFAFVFFFGLEVFVQLVQNNKIGLAPLL